jgi:hypothetical protein
MNESYTTRRLTFLVIPKFISHNGTKMVPKAHQKPYPHQHEVKLCTSEKYFWPTQSFFLIGVVPARWFQHLPFMHRKISTPT